MVFGIYLQRPLDSHGITSLLGLVLPFVFVAIGYQTGRLTRHEGPLSDPNVTEHKDDDDDEMAWIADGDLAAVSAGLLEPCKMVLVVRTDLGLTPGNIYSQCCEATLACYKALYKKNRSLVQHWERTGQAKIALRAKSEDQLLELEAIAKSLNLCARSILHPEKGESVRSVLAIGPAPVKLVDQVTGKLRLL